MRYIIKLGILFLFTGCATITGLNNTTKPSDSEYKKFEHSIAKEADKYGFEAIRGISENGDKFIILNPNKKVYFNSGSYFIKDSRAIKKFLSNFTQKNKIAMYIVGHTDSMGSDKSNQLLSELRAREVYKFLDKFGYDKKSIEYIGYGEEHPIFSNATIKGRAKNRRVELILSNNITGIETFLKNRNINTQYLNNHSRIGAGKVELSQKGQTRNQNDEEVKNIYKNFNKPKRDIFTIELKKREVFIKN
ncbi:MAG: OmpA family protein [Helicobacteraceae bacterium]|nr:OmpA family protein [Helicobacteraceae bacterium]